MTEREDGHRGGETDGDDDQDEFHAQMVPAGWDSNAAEAASKQARRA
jgi:hypothetical protein